jgi:hypothetical protein
VRNLEMAELSNIISAISRETSEDVQENPVGTFAGFGSIIGILAAVIGLAAGISLVPITSFSWEITSTGTESFSWILG